MGEPTFKAFKEQLSMLLRDLPKGTTADLLDQVCAYWNGRAVQGIFLREDDSGALDEDFELDENCWENWRPELLAWLADPRFTQRAELCEWLKETPPFEAEA